MQFCDLLKQYMAELDCSGKELARQSNLSTSIISRYRTGEKAPGLDSDALKALCIALSYFAAQKGRNDWNYEALLTQFSESLSANLFDYEEFLKRFQKLFLALDCKMKNLSLYTNYEISFLYRIKSGERRISEPLTFADKIAHFVADNYEPTAFSSSITAYNHCHRDDGIDCAIESLADTNMLYSAVYSWLSLESTQAKAVETVVNATAPNMLSFLEHMDSFNLEDYIKVIHFDELKVPTIPFHFATRKNYYGVSQMRQGELDFFKATVTSNQAKSIFMYSDMPMLDMAENMEFNRNWMFGIACALKKGMTLQIIHHLNRPLEELLLGLEAWIPIYMTGQVSPYYIPHDETHVFHHLHYVSEVAVLTGEGIQGFPEDGKYTLTNNKMDLTYYKKKKEQILSHALPLMEIYTKDRVAEFAAFLESSQTHSGSWHNIWPSLPIYTISDELLLEILEDNQVNSADQKRLLAHVKQSRKQLNSNLAQCHILDEFYLPNDMSFEDAPLPLALSSWFYHKPVYYTYVQFLHHLKLTKDFASYHENYQLKTDHTRIFQNIRLSILKDEYAVISKALSPSIHFVIRHPKLVQLLQNFDVDSFRAPTNY